MTNYNIELQRSNVTVAEFLYYVKTMCIKKGIYFNIERDYFEKPYGPSDSRYYVIGDKKVCYFNGQKQEWAAEDAACKSEICRNLPYDCQTYILNFDGSFYNEICEFQFHDDNRGYGYYYQANKDAE